MKFTRKPVTVEAVQWHAIGDHPAVVLARKASCNGVMLGPGPKMLGYDLTVPAIRLPNGWREVEPGDWIVEDADGTLQVCKPAAFATSYEGISNVGH